jgi:hypothetical protein
MRESRRLCLQLDGRACFSLDESGTAFVMAKPVTAKSFGKDWNAVIAHWAQGGSVNSDPEAGWAALEALERLRPGYLTQYFETQALGNAQFAHLLAHGFDLVACKDLVGVDSLLARIEHGERGAIVELGVIAFFVRSGFIPLIEPQRDGKVPDFAVDVADRRVFGEVIGPTWSDAATRLQNQLKEAAAALFASLARNQRLQVGFLVEPTSGAVERVSSAVNTLVGAPGVVRIDDVALARLDPVKDEVAGLDLGPSPAIGSAQFEFDADGGRVVNATAIFSDERAQRLIAGELHHFSREQPNVLVIDVGAVVGGVVGWVPLIERCFQPTRNTRLGAVLILERLFDGVVVPGAWRGKVLENPYARTPVPLVLIEGLANGLTIARDT